MGETLTARRYAMLEPCAAVPLDRPSFQMERAAKSLKPGVEEEQWFR